MQKIFEAGKKRGKTPTRITRIQEKRMSEKSKELGNKPYDPTFRQEIMLVLYCSAITAGTDFVDEDWLKSETDKLLEAMTEE